MDSGTEGISTFEALASVREAISTATQLSEEWPAARWVNYFRIGVVVVEISLDATEDFVLERLQAVTGGEATIQANRFDREGYDDYAMVQFKLKSERRPNDGIEVQIDEDGNYGLGLLISSISSNVYAWGFEPVSVEWQLIEELISKIWNEHVEIIRRRSWIDFGGSNAWLVLQDSDDLVKRFGSETLRGLNIGQVEPRLRWARLGIAGWG